MEKREQGRTLYQKGWKYADIASRLDVPLSTVKSWATRYWKAENVASEGCKKVAKKTQKVSTKVSKVATEKAAAEPQNKSPNKGGAPLGNVNAVGNHGGAPPENQNALKHGGYSKLMFATFAADKLQELGDTVDEESVLVEEIHLLTLRESYLLERIDFYSHPPADENGKKKLPMSLAGVVSSSDKRDFSRLDNDSQKANEDKAAYQCAIDRKAESGDRLPGNANHVTTTTEANYLIVERLERLLTDVQKQKARAVQQLADIRRLNGAGKNADADDWAASVEAIELGEDGAADDEA